MASWQSSKQREQRLLLRLVTAFHDAREEVDRARDRRRRDRRASPHLRSQHLDGGEHLPDHLVLLAQAFAARRAPTHREGGAGAVPGRSAPREGRVLRSATDRKRSFAAPRTIVETGTGAPWQPACKAKNVMELDEMLDRCRRLEERAGAVYRSYAAATRADPALCALWTALAREEEEHARAIALARARLDPPAGWRTWLEG